MMCLKAGNRCGNGLRRIRLLCLLALTPLIAIGESAFNADHRNERQMVQALEAYAVYKMGHYDDAFARFLDLANAGNVQGMLNVANMYAAGQGVTVDQEQASRWYAEASATGSVIAMTEYAMRLDQGLGTPKNAVAAAALREKIQQASRGSPAAGKAGKPVVMEEMIPQIERAMAEMDRMAMNKNAEAMLSLVDHNSRILVVLPGTRNWTRVGRAELEVLWRTGFESAGDYQYQRTNTQHSLTDSGLVSSRFQLEEEWRNALDGAIFRRIRIDNEILFSMEQQQLKVNQWKLHIRQADKASQQAAE